MFQVLRCGFVLVEIVWRKPEIILPLRLACAAIPDTHAHELAASEGDEAIHDTCVSQRDAALVGFATEGPELPDSSTRQKKIPPMVAHL